MHSSEAMWATFYKTVEPFLDERQRRLVAAAASQAEDGGIRAVARATGLSRQTIKKGRRELDDPDAAELGRVRRPGAGRKPLVEADPSLLADLEALVEPSSRGDPESPLRWTLKSSRSLAKEMKVQGHDISHTSVATLLHEAGYSLQSNRKTKDGADHPDRNAQFEHINAQAEAHLGRGQPVISVDSKKKELVGNFKNAGRTWRPKGEPEEVEIHDFATEAGKVTPYGVLDLKTNAAWVSVGTDHDTSEFAVQSIRTWWRRMGQPTYPKARRLLITADGGGSNGYRVRLWKRELQGLSDETGLTISVCHFPPGTSKWNKIEHRLFSQISLNWRGHPLTSHEAIVSLIGSTRTQAGLRVKAGLDKRKYPTKVRVTNPEMEELNLHRHDFHGEWNYTIRPRGGPG